MTFKRLRRFVVTLPLPLAVLWAGLDFLDARGPFWLGTNSDPSYVYLLNSLRLIEGHAPTHLDHPGVTVHTLGAVIIRGAHAVAARPLPLPDDVLREPEWYAHVIARTFLCFYAATLVLVGALILRATGRLALMWMVQAAPLLSPSCFFELTDVKPEPLLYMIAALLTATLCGALLRQPVRQGALVLLLGILTGAGVATKFTAVSLAAIPLICLVGFRERKVWAATALASFLVFTAPAWREWERAMSFVSQMTWGSGLYGQRLFAQELPYVDRLQRVVVEEIVFFTAQALGLMAALVARQRHRGESLPARRRALTMLWALLAAGTVQVALVLKHPYQPRYLLPALGLTGLTLAVSAWLVCWDNTGRRQVTACAIALAFCTGTVVIEAPRFWRRRAQVREATECQRKAREAAESAVDCSIVSYYRASSMPLALHQGDLWAGQAFTPRLAELYPRESFLTPERRIRNFKGMLEPDDLASRRCIVFQGSPGGPGRLYSHLPEARRDAFPIDGAFGVRCNCPWEAVFEIHPP